MESIVNNKITKIDAFIDEDTHYNELNRSILKKNDLLFSIAGSLGRTTIITDDILPANTNQALAIIRFEKNKDLNLKFIESRLNRYDIAKYIFQNLAVGAQPNLNLQQVGKIGINLPSYSEQNKIQNFLDYIDNKIELLEAKHKSYIEFKKYLMQQIFTQKLRFTENLGNLCNLQFGKLNANAMAETGKYRFYTCAKEYYFIDDYAYDTEALILSGNGEHCGYVHYYNGRFNAYQKTYILTDFNDDVDIKYVKYFLEKNIGKTIWRERVSSNTPYITTKTVKNIKINYPPIYMQKSIVNILENYDKKLELYEQQLFEIKNFKKGLLQQMFV